MSRKVNTGKFIFYAVVLKFCFGFDKYCHYLLLKCKYVNLYNFTFIRNIFFLPTCKKGSGQD